MTSVSAPIRPRTATRHRVAVLAWSLVLSGVIFLASFEQGALTAGAPLLHEMFHDARHLLGVPCH